GRRPDRGVALPDGRVVEQLLEGGQRSQLQAAAVGADAAQLLDALDVDQALGRGHVVLHEREQVGAAGQGRGVVPGAAEETDRLLLRGGARVLESAHQARLPSSAARTRLGVSGMWGTRTPMALATALEMQAPGEITGGSPRPTTPRSS